LAALLRAAFRNGVPQRPVRALLTDHRLRSPPGNACRLQEKGLNLQLMLTEYIQAAMRKAKYEILEGDEGFYGEIPGFQGVWANAKTLEECRDDLSEALETWLLFRISRGMKVPSIGKHKLAVEFGAV